MHIVKTVLSLLTAALLATSTPLALAQSCNPNIPLTKPDSRYTYNTAGDEVTDSVTGLVWKRCAEGMSWSGSTCTGTATLTDWLDARVQASVQTGWRLPNLKELISLVETACYNQAINQAAFPLTPNTTWSSTPVPVYIPSPYNYVFVGDFLIGGSDFANQISGNSWVRLVRGQ